MSDEASSARDRRLANLKPIQPGEVRNPTGSKVPKDIQKLRTYTNNDVERKLHMLLQMPLYVLKQRLESHESSAMEKLLGTIIYKGISQGDTVRAAFILERAGCRLPPMAQPLNINMHISNIQNLSNSELIDLGAEAIRVLKSATDTDNTGGEDD